MNTQFKAKLLQNLANKKGNKGFTLIELLVVVIIIGVLAAIALPNLLGQVGKARESEAKSTVGAMTRAQQAFFTEKGEFAGGGGGTNKEESELLEVPTGNEKYYVIYVAGQGVQMANGTLDPRTAIDGTGVPADNVEANQKNGTRDYISGIAYDPLNRTFSSAVCRADNAKKATGYALAIGNAPVNSNETTVDDVEVTCEGTTEAIR